APWPRQPRRPLPIAAQLAGHGNPAGTATPRSPLGHRDRRRRRHLKARLLARVLSVHMGSVHLMRTLPRTRAVDPTTPATPTPSAPPAASSPPARPTLDPAAARAVFATWSGDPVVVVASPPGAGKTRPVTHLGRDLAERARLRIAIAAQTRAQALDVANRIAALGANVTLLGRKGSTAPPGLHPDVHFAPGRGAASIRDRIVVATTARWQWI